jgi:hypothetical protein
MSQRLVQLAAATGGCMATAIVSRLHAMLTNLRGAVQACPWTSS